ncbi:hypothetical protein [Enterococcus casseliflavus]
MENGTVENKGAFLDLFSRIGGFRLGLEQAGNSVTVSVIYFHSKTLRNK